MASPLHQVADAVVSAEQTKAFIEQMNSGVILAEDNTGKLARIIIKDPIMGITTKGTLAVRRNNFVNIATFIMQMAHNIAEEEHDLVEVDLNLGIRIKKAQNSQLPTTMLTLTIKLWNDFIKMLPADFPRTRDFRLLSENLGYLWA